MNFVDRTMKSLSQSAILWSYYTTLITLSQSIEELTHWMELNYTDLKVAALRSHMAQTILIWKQQNVLKIIFTIFLHPKVVFSVFLYKYQKKLPGNTHCTFFPHDHCYICVKYIFKNNCNKLLKVILALFLQTLPPYCRDCVRLGCQHPLSTLLIYKGEAIH